MFGEEAQKSGSATDGNDAFSPPIRGSDVVLRRENSGCVIPRHKELALGTLKTAIKQAGISMDEFVAACKK
jgi:hypothetical protein